jgi:hypothetical protein
MAKLASLAILLTIGLSGSYLIICWILSAAGMFLTLGFVRTAKRNDSALENREPDSCQNA